MTSFPRLTRDLVASILESEWLKYPRNRDMCIGLHTTEIVTILRAEVGRSRGINILSVRKAIPTLRKVLKTRKA